MINLENSIVVQKSIDVVFDAFNQIEQMAWAFPTTHRVTVIDSNSVNVGVKLKLGLMPIENNLSMSVVERIAPSRLKVEGIATPGKGLAQAAKLADSEGQTHITMELDLEAINPGATRVHYVLTADAAGNLKRIYEAVIKGQRASLERDFMKNVAKLLSTEVVEEARAVA